MIWSQDPSVNLDDNIMVSTRAKKVLQESCMKPQSC